MIPEKGGNKMSTPHNQASIGDIAETVLMPGDPLRAKYLAETFLENVTLFNTVRNMLGYTGTYKGKRISVMGSGMGIPSIGIYSYELFTKYDVNNIIRIGTCGCYADDKFELLDNVLITEAFSFSTYAKEQNGFDGNITYASPQLLEQLRKSAKTSNISLAEARTHSSDVFYYEKEQRTRLFDRMRYQYGCDIIECECFALFHNAAVTGKHAAGLVTLVDLPTRDLHATIEQRQKSGHKMMEVALGIL